MFNFNSMFNKPPKEENNEVGAESVEKLAGTTAEKIKGLTERIMNILPDSKAGRVFAASTAFSLLSVFGAQEASAQVGNGGGFSVSGYQQQYSGQYNQNQPGQPKETKTQEVLGKVAQSEHAVHKGVHAVGAGAQAAWELIEIWKKKPSTPAQQPVKQP